MIFSAYLVEIADEFRQLLAGVPLTLELTAVALIGGAVLSGGLAAMRLSGARALDWPARLYVAAFRGTPLLVQIYLIYYGLGQFRAMRVSLLWPYLREPFVCAALALMLNTAAYSSEVLRGGIAGVPQGVREAARACGLSRMQAFVLVTFPIALRRFLPAYGNEIILIVKATSLASTVTLMEVTGIAAELIAQTYRSVEIFVCAGIIYLAINFAITRLVRLAERALEPAAR